MPHIIDPCDLTFDQLELIEKASLRLVFQAITDFADDAVDIFAHSPDKETDVAEDITREAMERMPGYPIGARIFGTIDYKRAGFHFEPEHSIRQALLVDSKAEKTASVARLQTTQTSLPIRHLDADGQPVDVAGELPTEMELRDGNSYLTTTIFAHYRYRDLDAGGRQLLGITLAALPNGRLADRYVPDAENTFWRRGPHSPVRSEKFRVRLSFNALKDAASWRIQRIQFNPEAVFEWDD